MKILSQIDLNAFHFRREGKGGMYPTPHASDFFPEDTLKYLESTWYPLGLKTPVMVEQPLLDEDGNQVMLSINDIDTDGNEVVTEIPQMVSVQKVDADGEPIFNEVYPERTLVYFRGVDAENASEETYQFTEQEIEDAKTPPIPPLPVPSSVSRKDFFLAASTVNITKATMQAAIDGIADAQIKLLAQIEFDESQEFLRDWPLLEGMASDLGIDSGALDDLFRLAKSYEGKSALA